MYYYIFSGPVAAGKNTIAKLLANSVNKGVHIDVDELRRIVVHPHKAPWDGKKGKDQQLLAIKNSCLLAKQFIKKGYSVTITNLLDDKTANLYKRLLKNFPFKIILFTPSFEEVKKRDIARGQKLTDDEFKMLYQHQQELTIFDMKIDNTYLKPEEVVKKLI